MWILRGACRREQSLSGWKPFKILYRRLVYRLSDIDRSLDQPAVAFCDPGQFQATLFSEQSLPVPLQGSELVNLLVRRIPQERLTPGGSTRGECQSSTLSLCGIHRSLILWCNCPSRPHHKCTCLTSLVVRVLFAGTRMTNPNMDAVPRMPFRVNDLLTRD